MTKCPHRTILLSLTLALAGCSRCETADDEAAIRALIATAVERAEAADAKGVMSVADKETFELIPQGLAERETRLRLMLFLRQSGKVAIHYPRPTVNVDRKTGVHAEVLMPFALLRKGMELPELTSVIDDPERWLAEVNRIADVYRLELWFIKKGDDWRVRKARIRQNI